MQTFKKNERLCSKKIIDLVFKQGQSIFTHPYKLIWLETTLETTTPVQLLIAAPKKHHKTAVARNHIKRLIKEAYRKNKTELYTLINQQKKQYAIVIISIAQEKPDYHETEKKIVLLLHKLTQRLNENS